MSLSEHVYCVAIAFKMTEQRICIKFCIKLEHSSTETIWMIRKAQLWATGDWELHHNIPSHASCLMQRFFFFFVKYQITQVT